MNHELRKGRFTSSQIFRLIKSGRGGADFSAPGLTYIKQKRNEIRLGRSLDLNPYSQAMAWGQLMEKICYEMLPFGYDLMSKDTFQHSADEFKNYWSGSPDLVIPNVMISEIKCYGLKKFAEYTDCLMQENIELLRADFPAEYWQIVSNCLINEVDFGEAVSFMPYKLDLEKIRVEVEETNFLERYDFEPLKFGFLTEKPIDELPYIDQGGYFKNVTTFRFEIPKEDKILLEEKVRLAIVELKK